MASPRTLLYLDTSGLTAYAWHKGQVTPLVHFAAGAEGVAAFGEFLAEQPASTRYSVLADLAEEGFHLETLPFVRGKDRRAMLARKGSQHLFGSPYITELPLGREASGRRDERILFLGLTRPATVEPWLDALSAAQAPLSGILTLPLLADRLASRLGIAATDNVLLVLLTPAGIRQIYFERGRLRFSRLATVPEGAANDLPHTLQEEVGRTHAYLSTQRLVPRGEPLAVRILASGPEASRLAEQLWLPAQTIAAVIPLEATAKRCRFRGTCAGFDALPLFLHWIVQDPTCPQLAPPLARRFHTLARARGGLLGLGLALFLGCLLIAARLYVDTTEANREAIFMSGQARNQEQGLQVLQASLPHLPMAPEALARLMDQLQARSPQQAPLVPAMTVLARALEQEPTLQLDDMEWSLPAQPPLGSSPLAGPAPSQGQLVARLRFPTALADDRRALVAISQGFAHYFQQQPGLTAEILKMPLELESSRILRNPSPSANTQGPTLEIRLTLREPQP